jgi:hypothetical protein
MPKASERRRSKRVPISVRISARIHDAHVPIGLGYARDLSLHGMYIDLSLAASAKLRIGEMVDVRFQLETFDRPLETRARIARLDQKGSEIHGIAVDFREIPNTDRRTLEKYVLQKLADGE